MLYKTTQQQDVMILDLNAVFEKLQQTVGFNFYHLTVKIFYMVLEIFSVQVMIKNILSIYSWYLNKYILRKNVIIK